MGDRIKTLTISDEDYESIRELFGLCPNCPKDCPTDALLCLSSRTVSLDGFTTPINEVE